MKVLTNRQYKKKKVHGHYFLDFSIENVRCYGKKQTIKLSDEKGKPYHWTILLGDNGVGKTSILKGIVSLAPSPKLIDWLDKWETGRFDGKLTSVFEANTVAAHGMQKLLKDQNLYLKIEQGHQSIRDLEYDEST